MTVTFLVFSAFTIYLCFDCTDLVLTEYLVPAFLISPEPLLLDDVIRTKIMWWPK